MAAGSRVKTYTEAELREMVARGEDKTDFARIDAKSDAELDAAIAADPDWDGLPKDWFKGAEAVPGRKVSITTRVDPDVAEWFRGQGKGWQTKLNAVLRAYMEAVGHAGPRR